MATHTNELDVYRKKCTFNVVDMKKFVEDEEVTEMKARFMKVLESDPIFHRPKYRPNPRELRKLNFIRALRIRNEHIIDYEVHNNDELGLNYLIFCHMYESSVAMKLGIYHGFFKATIVGLGNEEQKAELLPLINADKIKGCVAMTEVGHGSNVKKLQTTATFDIESDGFYLHSPDFMAAKCWVGNLGSASTHATVYAQLNLPRGECHGVHAFLVPIRNPVSSTPYPGLIIGDMGDKIGMNGLDNGFMMFNNYWVPRSSLLARISSVTREGEYNSLILDPALRFASSLIPLFVGRWCVLGCAWGNLLKATTIAVRYSTLRKQFGEDESGQETSVIEYQTQQVRLFPYVAAIYIYKTTLYSITNALVDINKTLAESEDCSELITEWHILVSAFKPLITWLGVDGIQQCREACGGHGYLYASHLGEIKDDNDSLVTLEGDNNVLTQQTSKFLAYIYKTHCSHSPNSETSDVPSSQESSSLSKLQSPLNSYYYLSQPDEIVQLRTFKDLKISNILSIYSFLVRHLVRKTIATYTSNLSKGQDKFTAHNNSQVFVARTLALVYCERYVIETFWTKVTSSDISKAIVTSSITVKIALTELCLLYSLWSLEKYLPYLYESGYFTSGDTVKLIQDSILHLCRKLKPNILSLIEIESPPDFILNSILGSSTGLAYKELQAAFYAYPGNFQLDEEMKQMLGKSHL